jgi:hypothetical protein
MFHAILSLPTDGATSIQGKNISMIQVLWDMTICHW